MAAGNGRHRRGQTLLPTSESFNPTSQGQKCDPEWAFVRQYVPELGDIPGKAVHEPHKFMRSNDLSIDYPAPIVDHSCARLEAIEAFKSLS